MWAHLIASQFPFLYKIPKLIVPMNLWPTNWPETAMLRCFFSDVPFIFQLRWISHPLQFASQIFLWDACLFHVCFDGMLESHYTFLWDASVLTHLSMGCELYQMFLWDASIWIFFSYRKSRWIGKRTGCNGMRLNVEELLPAHVAFWLSS